MTNGLVIPPPIFRVIKLELPEDIEDVSEVKVYQATTAEHDERDDFNSEFSRVFKNESTEVELKSRFSGAEQDRLEVFLTLAECNFMFSENEPVFKFKEINGRPRVAMSKTDFNRAYGRLPAHWSEALHQAVLSVNPDWNPDVQPGE